MARVAWLFLLAALVNMKPADGTEFSSSSRLPEVALDAGPFVLRLADLASSEVEGLRQVPGVEEVDEGTGRVVFQPYRGKAGRWVKGAEKIAEYLQPGSRAVARFVPPRDDAVCADALPGLSVQLTSPDGCVNLRGYAGAWPGLAEHEMLRDLMGYPARVVNLGTACVLVGRTRQGPCVVWPVNEQFFVCAYPITDPRRLVSYVNRFGSALPKDYRLDPERWVEREVLWRLAQLDRACPAGESSPWLWAYAPFLTDLFPEVFSRFGAVAPQATAAESREWLRNARQFLTANRGNFRYSEVHWGYVLKGTGEPRGPTARPR